MFITAAKIAIVDAIQSGFNALGQPSKNNTVDLIPRSVTIEYPIEEIEWPAVYIQFRPTTTQYTGLAPDILAQNQDLTWESIRQGYFEAAIDLQILAMSSEERDRIWEALINLFLMNNMSPASTALYNSIAEDDLIAMTILPGQVLQVGDTVSPGTPWSPEELTYEATIRVKCLGEFYENKYTQTLLPVSQIILQGTAEVDELSHTDTLIVKE